MTDVLIRATKVVVKSNKSRVLFQGLNLAFGREKVALIGRNGVGKSTLLSLLAGQLHPNSGTVTQTVDVHLVEQLQDPAVDGAVLMKAMGRPADTDLQALGLCWDSLLVNSGGMSHGELRKLRLLQAKLLSPEMLLLDEPTQDLDEAGVNWLKSWLSTWEDGLLVASHNQSLLEDFEHFFLVAESGCRYFQGSFSELQSQLDTEHSRGEERYIRRLNRLAEKEEKTLQVARRRGRKKRYGRVSELDRATPRSTLNTKRDYAQVKHGRQKKEREAKLGAFRDWAKSARRGLKVELPLVLPSLPSASAGGTIVELRDVGMRGLFSGLNLSFSGEKVGVVGPNGSGKSTLLGLMLKDKSPDTGLVRSDLLRLGAVTQAAENWCLKESLLECLRFESGSDDPKALTERLLAHKFPLSLAERPLRSLSPGERVRAALICLFQRRPVLELLVLDEPTYSLDLQGQAALTAALKAWQGGLVVASHDRAFLSAIGVERVVDLGGVQN